MRRKRYFALIENLKNMTPEEVADMDAHCDRLEKQPQPLTVDLCADCDKPFWVKRGHSGPLYCAYCGDEVAVFE